MRFKFIKLWLIRLSGLPPGKRAFPSERHAMFESEAFGQLVAAATGAREKISS
jgi:hypothetical protein